MPKSITTKGPFDRVRALCLGLPGVHEKEAWGAATFRVDRGKMFLMFADNHHGDGRVAIWCRTSPDTREALRAVDDDRYFIPPYVGPSGWVGVRLEGKVDWAVVKDVITEGHRLASPRKPPTKRAL